MFCFQMGPSVAILTRFLHLDRIQVALLACILQFSTEFAFIIAADVDTAPTAILTIPS
jgi:hypothetical protein